MAKIKRLIELPSGDWVDIDLIESVEAATKDLTNVRMVSGVRHEVRGQTPRDIMCHIAKAWKAEKNRNKSEAGK